MERDTDTEIARLRQETSDAERHLEEEIARLQMLHDQRNGPLSAEEIERQCDELFGVAPIPFAPRSGDLLDERIFDLVLRYNIRIPIVYIKDSLYLIGHQRTTVLLKSDNVVVRVGGGQDQFHQYVPINHRVFERALVLHMINSNESLEWVVDTLVQGQKVRGGNFRPSDIDTTPRLSSSPVRTSRASRGSPTRKSTEGLHRKSVTKDNVRKSTNTLMKSYRGPG